jgi:hypothetical protein
MVCCQLDGNNLEANVSLAMLEYTTLQFAVASLFSLYNLGGS